MILIVRFLYRLFLPVFLVFAAPAFLLKMRRRGGLDERLKERFGIYPGTVNTTTVLLQAVSVGETLVALKIVDELRRQDPDLTITLAVGTATGRQLAERDAPAGVQVIYAPVDLTWMVQACLEAVAPRVIGFIEGECWPNLVREASRRRIPMALLSARLSSESASLYERFPFVAREQFSRLRLIGVADEAGKQWWEEARLGGPQIEITGNVKFDPEAGKMPEAKAEFSAILEAAKGSRPVLLASSTHAGEELLLAEAAMGSEAFLAIAPRHVERADALAVQLESLGWDVLLRSRFKGGKLPSAGGTKDHRLLLIDTTGELRDWTAHADWVLIGKTFVNGGGQSPIDAILARKPLIAGPEMNNFGSLFEALKNNCGIRVVEKDELAKLLGSLNGNLDEWQDQASRAAELLDKHRGAAARSARCLVGLLRRSE